MLKKFRDKFLQTLRLAFLKRKHFLGSYADNQIAMRKWKADSGVMVQYIEDNRMKFTPVMSTGEKPDVMRELVKEQARQYNRTLRKKHNCTVWYVEDHIITKALGWKRGKEDHLLSDRQVPTEFKDVIALQRRSKTLNRIKRRVTDGRFKQAQAAYSKLK